MRQVDTIFRISPVVYVMFALSLLIVPLRWLIASIIAASVHEAFHILALRFFKRRIYSIQIGFRGVQLHTEPMTNMEELICALSGPIGGLVLLLCVRLIPLTALCAAFQTLYNLLPVYPSDGSRALRCGTKLFLRQESADKLCGIIEIIFLTGVTLLGIYGSFYLRLGIMPAVIAFILVWNKLHRKIPLQTGRSQGTIYPL